MKTTISFEFGEGEDNQANIIVHAMDWYNVVWTMWDFLVTEAHKGYEFGDDGREIVNNILDKLLAYIDQHGLTIE